MKTELLLIGLILISHCCVRTEPYCGPSVDRVDHGSVIVIEHEGTQKALHSHSIRYGGESKQQEITCFSGNDSNNHWIIEHANLMKIGTEFKQNDVVKLIHQETGNYLHSHSEFKSPKTEQQEVTAWWGKDSNDDWKLDLMGETFLKVGKKFTLRHVNTGKYLHSHAINLTSGNAAGQQEVTGFTGVDGNNNWIIREIKSNILEKNVSQVDDKDIITFRHIGTNKRLHSHYTLYVSGSQQQEVVGWTGDDKNDHWVIEVMDKNKIGKGIKHNDEIKLIHKHTNCALHSHEIRSQASNQFEVSCFQGRDDNDIWKVDLMGEKYWNVGKNFRLFHKASGRAMHSHNINLTTGSLLQEVTTYWSRDSNDYWNIDTFVGKAVIA